MNELNFSTYVGLIKHKRKLHEVNNREKLDQIENALLEQIILNWAEGRKVGLRALYQAEKLGSLVTLNSRIKNLVAKGYIRLVPDVSDKRIKYAVPSERTIECVESLSSYIHELTNANSNE